MAKTKTANQAAKQTNFHLGRSLIKNQHKNNSSNEFSDRHTTDTSSTIQSITENTSLEEFLSKTELANKQFDAEKENITIVNPNSGNLVNQSFVPNEELELELLIPRRPKDYLKCTPEQLKELENENYLKWRRKLALLQEKDGIVLTPFEKNLDFWRQLWRVVERSDVLIQILDARNPLLFYCEDLDRYIQEIDSKKSSLILLNKSDYLTDAQRKCWLRYFSNLNKKCIFFSALEQQAKIDRKQIQKSDQNSDDEDDDDNDDDNDDDEDDLLPKLENLLLEKDFSEPFGYEELISYFKSFKNNNNNEEKSQITIGFVGYPNVGKSSTINALLRGKKVSVSATPGKTKHFQTIILDKDIIICDCPGLVFPNIVSNKAEMIINGILPIDQIKDVKIAIDAICSKIPAHIFERLYGIILKKPNMINNNGDKGDDEEEEKLKNFKVSSLELLTVYGYSRGFMTSRGLPDQSKSAKFILKDFVQGKILFCYAPPDIQQEYYHEFDLVQPKQQQSITTDRKLIKLYESNDLIKKDFDQEFFHNQKFISSAHVKDPRRNKNLTSGPTSSNADVGTATAKPWRNHPKRNRKEKLRRIYGHLDN